MLTGCGQVLIRSELELALYRHGNAGCVSADMQEMKAYLL